MFEFDFETLPSADDWAPEEAPSPPKPRPPAAVSAKAATVGSKAGIGKVPGGAKDRALDRTAKAAGPAPPPPPTFSSPGLYRAFEEPRIFRVLARAVLLRQSASLDAPWRGVRQWGELVQVVGASGFWLRLADTEIALDGAGTESLWLYTVVGEDGSGAAEATASAALLLYRGVASSGDGASKKHAYPRAGQSAVEELSHRFALGLYTQMIVERCSDTFAPPLGCLTVDPRRLAGAFTPTIHAPGSPQVRAWREQRPRGDFGLDPWRVFATHRHARDEVIETCPLLRAKTRAYHNSLALGARMVSGVGSKSLPLGVGCLYRRVDSHNEANVYFGVSSSAGVMVLHAARAVREGEELLLGSGALPRYLEGDPRQSLGGGGGIGSTVPRSPRPALEVGLTAGAVRWGHSPVHERGVFAAVPFETGDVVELCPAIVLDEAANGVFDDFTMEFSDLWGQSTARKKFSVLALGFGPLYNHREPGFNVVWGWLEGFGVVEMRAARDIEEGEELFISYGSSYWESRGAPH